MGGCEHFDDSVLGEVGVLVLINQYIPKLVLEAVQDIGMLGDQCVGLEQQVVEVHGPGAETALRVCAVDLVDVGSAG